jgi:phosphate butyryltransferase
MSEAGPDTPPAAARPRNLQELVEAARRQGPRRLAVAAADEADCLAAVAQAAQLGLVIPILVGARERIVQAAAQAGENIERFEILEAPDHATAAASAVRLVHDGAADLLMKGLLGTKILMQAVLDREFGLRSRGVLSHVAVFDAPDYDRLVLLTDAAVNVNPRFARKIEIITNALATARRLGIVRPKVAVLAAVEKLDLPAMPATLDAEMLRRLGESGFFGDARVAGPMSLDAALSPERSAAKGLASTVAGDAEVLVAPNIETANTLYKSITCIARHEIAGAVVGAKCPIVVTSRADTPQTKLNSIALAALLCGEEPTT